MNIHLTCMSLYILDRGTQLWMCEFKVCKT